MKKLTTQLIQGQLREETKQLIISGDATRFRQFLESSLTELNHVDFKEEDDLEPKKLAKHILGLANTGGGCLIFGVSDGSSTEGPKPVGCIELQDPTKVKSQLNKLLTSELVQNITFFDYDAKDVGGINEGRRFRAMFVEPDALHLPYYALRNSTGGEGLDANTVYVRRHGASAPANHKDIESLVLQKQIARSPVAHALTLDEDLKQLACLYDHIKPTKSIRVPREVDATTADVLPKEIVNFHTNISSILGPFLKAINAGTELKEEPNQDYPSESFDAFVASAIRLKKKKILKNVTG